MLFLQVINIRSAYLLKNNLILLLYFIVLMQKAMNANNFAV